MTATTTTTIFLGCDSIELNLVNVVVVALLVVTDNIILSCGQ